LEEHLEAGAEVVKEGVVQRVDAFEAFEARRRRARCASSALMPCRACRRNFGNRSKVFLY
jgi:hypothetical protein